MYRIPYAKHVLHCSTGEREIPTEMRCSECLCERTEGAASHPSIRVNESVTSGSLAVAVAEEQKSIVQSLVM